jgi:hypothetical protein
MAISHAADHTIFILDTDAYANFERELTAFLTGVVGECGTGEEQAEIFEREHPDIFETFQEIVAMLPDENGCYRPTSIWATPEEPSVYNSVAIFFYVDPPSDLITFMLAKVRKFKSKSKFKVLRARLIKQEIKTTVLWEKSL